MTETLDALMDTQDIVQIAYAIATAAYDGAWDQVESLRDAALQIGGAAPAAINQMTTPEQNAVFWAREIGRTVTKALTVHQDGRDVDALQWAYCFTFGLTYETLDPPPRPAPAQDWTIQVPTRMYRPLMKLINQHPDWSAAYLLAHAAYLTYPHREDY